MWWPAPTRARHGPIAAKVWEPNPFPAPARAQGAAVRSPLGASSFRKRIHSRRQHVRKARRCGFCRGGF